MGEICTVRIVTNNDTVIIYSIRKCVFAAGKFCVVKLFALKLNPFCTFPGNS